MNVKSRLCQVKAEKTTKSLKKLIRKDFSIDLNLKICAILRFLAQNEIFVGHDLQVSHSVLKTAEELLPGVDSFACQ